MSEWRAVPGWPKYEVSRDGRVRSLWRAPRILSPSETKGYPRVTLTRWDGGTRVRRKQQVHRLVASAWLPPPKDPTWVVGHLDGDSSNPAADNLRWMSQSENCRMKLLHGTLLRGPEHPSSRLSCDECLGIMRAVDEGASIRSQARKHGVSPRTIRDVLHCRSHSSQRAGHIFSQEDSPYYGVGVLR